MEFFKLQLFSQDHVYGVRQYFPYTDKPFFKCLDDILEDESLQVSLANMFVQLYKDELVFEYPDLDRHCYIVPINHKSSKFTMINRLLCSSIASYLGMQVLDDYFESFDVPFVDIRDEYTKKNNEIEVKINKTYANTPVIIFDCCCSTGKIFDCIIKACNNSDNLYLCYGFRFNAGVINNTSIKRVTESEFSIDPYMEKNDGFFVRIFGLFGKKNVQVDFRDKFSICIGENGFGKTTAFKLALLSIQYVINHKNAGPYDLIEDLSDYYLNLISRFYFKKIEIYYTGHLLKNDNGSSLLIGSLQYEDVIPSKKTLIEAINDKNVASFLEGLSSSEFETITRKIILDDRSIEMDYKNIEMENNAQINFNIIDEKLRRYLHKENIAEKNDYIDVGMHNFGFVYFNCAKSRYIVSKPPRDRIKLDNYVNKESYDDFIENDPFISDVDYHDEIDWDEQSRIKEDEELSYYKNDDPQAFDYDDPEDYNPYEDDFDDSYADYYYDSYEDFEDDGEDYEPSDDEIIIEKSGITIKDLKDNNDKIKNAFYSNIEYAYFISTNDYKSVAFNESFEEDNQFLNDKIRIDKVLHKAFIFNELSHNDYFINTNLYSILEQIIQYDQESIRDNKITIELLSGFPKVELDINKFLSANNRKLIKKYFDDIFSKEYNTIIFGIYDVLKDSQFKTLSSIIKRLRTYGMKKPNDYVVVLGLKLLVDSYKKDFIVSKKYLLEKLLNKYLIGKRACIYANSLTILDDDNKYIPIDRLSTGERDLIIMFCLCLLECSRDIIILDEPDLSMSVDWQSKILVDLIKYTSNDYIIVSQSPLLVQNNNLAFFVKRLDFDDNIDILEDDELKEEIIKHYSCRSSHLLSL